MIKQILIVLVLISCVISEFNSIKQRKQELTELCENVSRSKILPDNMANRYKLYLSEIESKKRDNGLVPLGMLLGLFLAPVIAPLFAAPGLFGAAAVSNGLATIGGGSLAAGGLGMMGGSTVLMLSGGAIGSMLSYSNNVENYDAYMQTQSSTFYDSLHIGDYTILGTFNYLNGNTYINGQTKIHKNQKIIFDGNVSCDPQGCSLLGDFL